MASSDVSRIIAELALCSICQDDFKDPRYLPCLHSFCLRCLEAYCKHMSPGNDIPCPLCKKEFKIPAEGLTDLESNVFLHNLVDAKAAKQNPGNSSCEPCFETGRTEKAIVYCVDCSQKLCDRCSTPHKKWKGRPHDVRPMGDELSAELIWLRGSYCDKHPDKRLELYCFDCKGNVCMKCFAVFHQQHKCGEIDKVAREFVASLKSDMKPFPPRVSQYRAAIRKIEMTKDMFVKKIEKIEQDLDKKGEEIKRLVDDHLTRLKRELANVKANSVKEAKSHVDRFELAVTALDSFQNYSSLLTTKGSPCDITRTAAALHSRADELLKTIVSGDYRPPDVQFVPVGVAKLTEANGNVVGALVKSNGHQRSPSTVEGMPTSTAQVQAQVQSSAANRERTTSSASVSPVGVSAKPQAPVTRGNLATQPATPAANRLQPGQPSAQKKTVESVRLNYLRSSPKVAQELSRKEAVRAMTLLNDELYVLRDRDTNQLDVYSTRDLGLGLQRRLSVRGLSKDTPDIASCGQKHCVYISDNGNTCIHRVGLDKSVSKWPVKVKFRGLSVTRSCNLLLTCCHRKGEKGKLVELSSRDGKQIREITLPSHLEWPAHGLQLPNYQYVVCDSRDLSLIDDMGRLKQNNNGDAGMKTPGHLVADCDNFVFVVDEYNKRIALFDPSLNYVRIVIEPLHSGPRRLCFDDVTRRLYVGQNDGVVSIVQM